jgi:hypothetical protein
MLKKKIKALTLCIFFSKITSYISAIKSTASKSIIDNTYFIFNW